MAAVCARSVAVGTPVDAIGAFDDVLRGGVAGGIAGVTPPPSATGPVALTLAASPRAAATAVYTKMLDDYAAAEKVVVGEK